MIFGFPREASPLSTMVFNIINQLKLLVVRRVLKKQSNSTNLKERDRKEMGLNL